MKQKTGSIILKIITVLLALLVVYLVCVKVSGGIPQFFGYRILAVRSDSMEDTISVGDYILIKNVDTAEIKVDDIITFNSSDPKIAVLGAPITHRVIDINEDGSFVTKGDHNAIKDDEKYPVKPENVIGIYVKTLPFIAWLVNQFRKPYIYIFIVMIPLLTVLAVKIIRILNISKNKKTGGGDDNEPAQTKED